MYKQSRLCGKETGIFNEYKTIHTHDQIKPSMVYKLHLESGIFYAK